MSEGSQKPDLVQLVDDLDELNSGIDLMCDEIDRLRDINTDLLAALRVWR